MKSLTTLLCRVLRLQSTVYDSVISRVFSGRKLCAAIYEIVVSQISHLSNNLLSFSLFIIFLSINCVKFLNIEIILVLNLL